MATQELRTQLVFEAAGALKSSEALASALDKIANIDFSRMTAGLRTLTETLRQSQRMAGATASGVTKSIGRAVEETAATIVRSEQALRARLDRIRYQAEQKQLSLWGRIGKDKPFDEYELEKIARQFRRWSDELNRIDPTGGATNQYSKFIEDLRVCNQMLRENQAEAAAAKAREQALNEELKVRTALTAKLAAEESRAQKTREQTLNEELKIRTALAAKLAAEESRAQKLTDRIADKLNALSARQADGGFINQSELDRAMRQLRRWAAELDRLTGTKLETKAIDVFASNYEKHNRELQMLAAERKEEEAKLARYERLTRLAGRLAEIQARVNERFSAGRMFSEYEFIKLRNQIHNIGAEMDRLTGKDVSTYADNILNRVRVSETPTMNARAMTLADQFNVVRQRAEQAAMQLERTRSIGDAIRFNMAMRDLQSVTREAKRLNSALSRTEGLVEQITNVMKGRLVWRLGDELVWRAMTLPDVMLQSYRELEQAMAGVQQVMPLIEGRPGEVFGETTRLIDIAADFARSAREVTEGAQLWGRGYGKPANDLDKIRATLEETNEVLAMHGQSLEEVTDQTAEYINRAEAMATTNELVRQSAMLATVDNFSMAESVKGLEAVLAAYGLRAKTAAEATLYAGRAVDIISKVAHYGQISAQDLVRGIESTGKAAEQAGVSLEFLSAMIETGVRNTAKSGADIGNAIKALTVGIYSGPGQEALSKFGIETTYVDEDGLRRMRSAQAIILDIASALKDGDVNAQKMLLAISGGRYQYSKISAILRDEEEILRMWSEALDSAGFADKQLEVQMETINAKLKQLEANLTQLYATMMSGTVSDVLKTGIEMLSKAVKTLEENLQAAKVGGAALLGVFAAGKILTLVSAFVSLTKNVRTFQQELKAAGYAGGLLGVLKTGIKGIPDEWQNRSRQRAVQMTNALTASERTLTVAQQQQIQTQSIAIAQALEMIGLRTRETTVNGIFLAQMRAKTAAIATNTAALGANAAAASAASGASLAAGAAATVATAGLNLVIGAVMVGVPLLLSWAAASDTIDETLDNLTDATRENLDALGEERNALSQEIVSRRGQLEMMDKAIEYYESSRAAIARSAEGTKEHETATRNLKTAEAVLTKALGRDAVERIKASSDVRVAYEKEKSAFVKGTDEKRRQLEALGQKTKEQYTRRLEEANGMLEMYRADIAAFGEWKRTQTEGLSTLQSMWLRFWQFVYNMFGGGVRDRSGIKLRGWAEDIVNYAKEQGTVDLRDKVQAAERTVRDLQTKLVGLESTTFEEEPYEGEIDSGVIADTSDEASSPPSKRKVVEQYDTLTMRYLGAIAAKDRRLTVSDLESMVGYIQGGDGTSWAPITSGTVNGLGVTQSIMDKYLPSGSLEREGDVARAFTEALLDFEGSGSEFIEYWYRVIGMARDASDAAILREKTLNQSEYLTNGALDFVGKDYQKRLNYTITKNMKLATDTYLEPTAVGGLGSWRRWTDEITGGQMSDDVFQRIVSTASTLGYTLEQTRQALALATAESNGVQSVTSSVGAHGVFQLMPETASELGVDLYDTADNIRGGLMYFKRMLDKYGDWRLAAAAYNAGEGNVDKYGGIPPFEETREYVDRIGRYLTMGAPSVEAAVEAGTGEGRYWIKQNSGVSYAGAKPETMQAIDALGKWFYDQTGHPLVVTAVTNGRHAAGDRGHHAGWKFDVNDFGSGAEGSLTTDDLQLGYLVDRFVKYAQAIGLGANVEGVGTENIHIDVSTLGDQWEGEYAGTNFGGFKPMGVSPSLGIVPVEVVRDVGSGELDPYWSELNDRSRARGLRSLRFDRYPQYEESWRVAKAEYERESTQITRARSLEAQLKNLRSSQGLPADSALEEELDAREYDLERRFIERIEVERENLTRWSATTKEYIDQYRAEHGEIASMLSSKGLEWSDLTVDQQLSIAEKMNSPEFSDAIKLSNQLDQSWSDLNKQVEEHKQKLIELRGQAATRINIPTVKAEERENNALQLARLWYEGAAIDVDSEDQTLQREYKARQLAIYRSRLERLRSESASADDRAASLRAKTTSEVRAAEELEASLLRRKDAGEDVNSELAIQTELVRKLRAEHEMLERTETSEQLTYRAQIKETENAIKNLETVPMPTVNAEEHENNALRMATLEYEGSTIGSVFEDRTRLREYKARQLAIMRARLERLKSESQEADVRASRQRTNIAEQIRAAESVEGELLLRQAAGEDVNRELARQTELVQKLRAAHAALESSGTDEQMKYRVQLRETENAIKQLEEEMYPLEKMLRDTLANGVVDMFDSILIKGNSFKDAWNNLWESIASIALKQLVLIGLQRASMSFGWSLFGGASGGEIPGKATGGSLSGGAPIKAGLIRGAGTGTSDSILTYLEDKGQFIRTSDGEFIVRKKAVDALGVTFLNRLNENPEQIALKEKILGAYAGGGALGEEMEPVMSEKTVENYRSYARQQAEKETRNVRQERLLETISLQLSAFTRPVNETTNMNINAVDSRSFAQLLERHSDVILGLLRKERGRRNMY